MHVQAAPQPPTLQIDNLRIGYGNPERKQQTSALQALWVFARQQRLCGAKTVRPTAYDGQLVRTYRPPPVNRISKLISTNVRS